MPSPAHEGERLERVVFEIKRVIVGQDRLVERMLVGLLARGHLLLEGVPGVAKTLAVETFAKVVGGTFSRLQFTPDLVPADILGTRIYRQGREEFDVELGPVVANFVLADEINRAPAKVQSAMLEVMAERHLSIGGQTFPMPDPFLVLATQNPIENEGVYPLPEAQRDRFLFKIIVEYPGVEEEREIVYRMGVEPPVAQQVLEPGRAVPAAGRGHPGVRAPRAGRLRGPAGRGHPHPGRARADRRRRLGVLRRLAARHARASSPRPARSRWSAAGTTCCRRTCWTSPRTCCGTGWCCPTTRWPTRCRSTTSSPGCWPTVPLPQVSARPQPATRRSTPRPGARRRDQAPRRAPRADRAAVAAGRPAGGRAAHAGADRARAGWTGCCRATTSGWCPARAPSRGRRAPTSPATTCGGWTGRSPPAPPSRTSGRPSPTASWRPGWCVDLSPSLDFGTAACEKRDLAVAALAAVAHLTRGGGNRIGARRRHRRADRRGSRPAAGWRTPAGCSAGSPRRPRAAEGTRGDLAERDRAAAPPAAPARARRGDLRLPRRARPGSGRCGRCRRRHDLLAVEVLDPRELELPDVGTVVLADPETGPAARGASPRRCCAGSSPRRPPRTASGWPPRCAAAGPPS